MTANVHSHTRRLPKRALTFPLMVFTLMPQGQAMEPSPTATGPCVGVWLSEHRDWKIQTMSEGPALIGRVIAVQAKDATALDTRNPDPALRGQPLLGHAFLRFTTWNERRRRWEVGTVYDSENGDYHTNATLTVIDGWLVLTVSGLGGLWSEQLRFSPIISTNPRQGGPGEPVLVHVE